MRWKREFVLLMCFGVVFYCVEVVLASWLGKGLPGSPWMFIVAMTLLVPVVLVLTLYQRVPVSRVAFVVTTGTIIGMVLLFKFYLWVGLSHLFVYAAVFLGILPAPLILSRTNSSGERLAGVVWIMAIVLVGGRIFFSAGGTVLFSLDRIWILAPISTALISSFSLCMGRTIGNRVSWNLSPKSVLGVILIGLFVVPSVIFWKSYDMPWVRPGKGPGAEAAMDSGGADSSPRPPNVILISVDTLNANAISEANRVGVSSLPNLSELKRSSVRLTRTFSTSSWTLPAHASLFTGLMPSRHGATNKFHTPIFDRIPSLVQTFRAAGYQTAAFTDGGYVRRGLGFGRGFDRYQHRPRRYSEYLPGLQEILLFALRSTRFSIDFGLQGSKKRFGIDHRPSMNYFRDNVMEARRWLGGRDPFFLFLQTFQVHDWFREYPAAVNWLKTKSPKLARSLYQPPDFKLPHEIEIPDDYRARFKRRRERLPDSWEKTFNESFSPVGRQYVKRRISFMTPATWKFVLDMDTSTRRKYLRSGTKKMKHWVRGGSPGPRFTVLHPWMQFLATVDVFHNRFRGDFDALVREGFLTREQLDHLTSIARRQLRAQRKLYYYGLKDVDRALGNFMEHLKNKELLEETVVVFVSDHGEGFSLRSPVLSHGLRLGDQWGQLQDRVIRVPVWIRLPEEEPIGRTYQGYLQLNDILPLLMEHYNFGIQKPSGSLSDDFLEKIQQGRHPAGRRFVRSEVQRHYFFLEPLFSVRSENYRLEQSPATHHGVFWSTPDTAVSDRPLDERAVPQTVRKKLRLRMKRRINQYENGDKPYKRRFPFTPKVRRQLEGLGYM